MYTNFAYNDYEEIQNVLYKTHWEDSIRLEMSTPIPLSEPPRQLFIQNEPTSFLKPPRKLQ